MKYGILYSYWGNQWDCNYPETAKRVAQAGFDILEVGAGHLLTMTDREKRELVAVTKDLGIGMTANIGPARQYDVSAADPEIRRNGVKFLSDIMRAMDTMDIRRIVGVMYSCWPYHFEDLDKPAIWGRAVESAKQMGDVAADLGIDMCMEVVNRFESNLLNTAAEGVQFCRDVDKPRIRLLMDTFHMNIEEDNIADAIRLSGSYLGQIHIGEGNRKLPGCGSLPWKQIGQALRDINFQGDAVMEPFLLDGGQVGRDIHVWRDLSDHADTHQLTRQAAEALAFLKEAFA